MLQWENQFSALCTGPWVDWTPLDIPGSILWFLFYFFFPISLAAEFILNPIQLFPSPIGLSGWLVCPPGGLGRETHHGDCHSDWLCCWWVMPITITILITIFILSLLRIRKIMMIAMMERWQKYRKWLWCWWKLNLKELKRWLQSDEKVFICFCVKQSLGFPRPLSVPFLIRSSAGSARSSLIDRVAS